MKQVALFASALFLGSVLSIGTASAQRLSSTTSLKSSNVGVVETAPYRPANRAILKRDPSSFAFAPGSSSRAIPSCNRFSPWTDEEFDSAFASWSC